MSKNQGPDCKLISPGDGSRHAWCRSYQACLRQSRECRHINLHMICAGLIVIAPMLPDYPVPEGHDIRSPQRHIVAMPRHTEPAWREPLETAAVTATVINEASHRADAG